MTFKTIQSDSDLPPAGKYVLARHNRGTWHESTDQENVNCVVVKLVWGLSLADREKMKAGEMPCESERWKIWRSEDEGSNNARPYCWQSFGSNSFNGQEIDSWCEIPK